MSDQEPQLLTVDEVLELHADQLRLFGGTEGLRDRNALESAVATPWVTFGGEFLHATVFDMAAAYAFHIAENQPFLDGNKRTALNAALVFLEINGVHVEDPTMQLYDAMLGLAARTITKGSLADLFRMLANSSRNLES
ncbi:MAG: type II toxin-antitoxin system death-on-curing family toxin [Byssovorax sp.]